MGKAKRHCGEKVMLVSDFVGEFFFMCNKRGLESNAFDSHKERPDDVALKRIQFRKLKRGVKAP